jgi:CheY-like chemotaxis protein
MRRTVLVVDADADARDLLRSALRERGYGVMEAPDGIVAWSLSSHKRPDLISMEHPRYLYGGRTLLDTIRADAEMAGVKVLIVSACSTAELDLACDQPNACYLPKPIDSEAYAQLVESLIGPLH